MKDEKDVKVTETENLGKPPESSEDSDNPGSEKEKNTTEIPVEETTPVSDTTSEIATDQNSEVLGSSDIPDEKESEIPSDDVKGTESRKEPISETSEEVAEEKDEASVESDTTGGPLNSQSTINTDTEAEPLKDQESEKPSAPDSEVEEESSESAKVKSEVSTKEPEKAESEDVESKEAPEDHPEEGDEHTEHEEEIDYSTMDKEQLVAAIIELSKSDDILRSYRHLNEMLPHFEEIRKKEREEALDKFLKEGGEEADFDMGHDELTDRFEANERLIRDKRNKFIRERESQKESNYEKKLDVLERMREFVDSEETNISFDKFKELQEEWRAIGPVPQIHNRTLWANYHALMDRFYDNRSIYFELKELDRKKNLTQKLELCERAEKLADVEVLKDAIKDLNELHEEFKHIGPVPKEEQEPLWQRFKAASDAVYARRKAFVATLKVELEANLEKKLEFCEKATEFLSFDSDRIKEWNQKTKEILELQKKWENIGGIPRAKAKETNKKFWGAFKGFFNNKNQFFRKLDAEREGNLEKKRKLVEKANEIKESEDWLTTMEEFKKLQREWKEIGPVPQKMREKIFAEFKKAGDHFFDRKRANSDSQEADFHENLKKKEAICENIEKETGSKESSIEQLKEFEREFNELGFVPRKSIKAIKNRFKESVDKYIEGIPGLNEQQKEELILKDEIRQMQEGPNAERTMNRKQQEIRRKISGLENDIALWKNNLEFFAASKTADKLREEFEAKIDKASDDLNQLKKQLRLLRKAQ